MSKSHFLPKNSINSFVAKYGIHWIQICALQISVISWNLILPFQKSQLSDLTTMHFAFIRYSATSQDADLFDILMATPQVKDKFLNEEDRENILKAALNGLRPLSLKLVKVFAKYVRKKKKKKRVFVQQPKRKYLLVGRYFFFQLF